MKFKIGPENRPSQQERIVFQPSIFGGYVCLQGKPYNYKIHQYMRFVMQ